MKSLGKFISSTAFLICSFAIKFDQKIKINVTFQQTATKLLHSHVMHCLSISNTFPVHQSGKTDVIKTINCYYVSKNNCNCTALCIKEQVESKIKGCLHVVWSGKTSHPSRSHFTAVPTLQQIQLLLSALNYSSACTILLAYTETRKTYFQYKTSCFVKYRNGGRRDIQLHT